MVLQIELTVCSALYHTSTIILHRPFVESTEEFFSDSKSTTASWSACVAAAVAFTQCLRLYRQIFTIRRAPYLISYATYVASTIHVRAVAAENAILERMRQSNGGENGKPAQSEPSDATKALKLCWDALVEAGKVNAGCRKAQNIIAGLMNKLGISLGQTPRVLDAPLPDGGETFGMRRDASSFSAAHYRHDHPPNTIEEINTTPIAPEPAMPAEHDIESIMRSFWWPEPFDVSIPGQHDGESAAFGSLAFRPVAPADYTPSAQPGPTGNTPAPAFTSSMMNTGFDPSLGAPIHQLQQPVFAHPSGLATPASNGQAAVGGMGEDFPLLSTAGATSAMLDPLIGFLHEEPFYGV